MLIETDRKYLPNPGVKPRSPTLQADSLSAEPQGKPKNTGVGSLSLLQQIFPTQEANWNLLHYRQILYQLSQQGSPAQLPMGSEFLPENSINLEYHSFLPHLKNKRYRKFPYKFLFKLDDFEISSVKRKEKQKLQFPISFLKLYTIFAVIF